MLNLMYYVLSKSLLVLECVSYAYELGLTNVLKRTYSRTTDSFLQTLQSLKNKRLIYANSNLPLDEDEFEMLCYEKPKDKPKDKQKISLKPELTI